jgi:predicted amidohydrolase
MAKEKTMIRKNIVAAAQMIGPPADLCGGVIEYKRGDISGVKAINASLILGSDQTVTEAKKIIANIDADGIRKHSVSRMLEMMDEANKSGVELIVFPELSLPSFFPYFYIEDKNVLHCFFETGDIRKGLAKPLFQKARKLKMNISFGYAELTPKGQRYNTQIIYDYKLDAVYKYRKTHIPGFEKPKKGKVSFQFEKGIFQSSSEGYPVFDCMNGRIGIITCHDRRYSNPFLAMGMSLGQNVELVINGYNTPFNLSFAGAAQDELDAHVYDFHYIPQQGQAITEGTFIVSVAIAGNVFGVEQIAGSCIISPLGEILQKTEELKEVLLIEEIDLDKAKDVRIQKYDGDRTESQVLLKEVVRKLGVKEALGIIRDISGVDVVGDVIELAKKFEKLHD